MATTKEKRIGTAKSTQPTKLQILLREPVPRCREGIAIDLASNEGGMGTQDIERLTMWACTSPSNPPDMHANAENETAIPGPPIMSPTLAIVSLDLSSTVQFASQGAPMAASLAHVLHNFPSLRRLILRSNCLCVPFADQGFDLLCSSLHSVKNLEVLDLCGNEMGPQGSAFLSHVLHALPRLTTLDLSCNNVGPEGAFILADGLVHLRELCSLDLGVNSFLSSRPEDVCDPRIVKLATAVVHLPHLVKLTVDQPIPLKTIRKTGADSKILLRKPSSNDLIFVAELLRSIGPQIHNVTSLSIAHCAMGTGAAIECCLTNAPALTSVNLSQNALSSQNLREGILCALSKLHHLKALNLERNSLGRGKGLRSYLPFLSQFISLERLNLAHNLLSAQDKPALVQLLSVMPKLQHLRLAFNPKMERWTVVDALKAVQEAGAPLRSLDLAGMGFEPHDAKYLSDVLSVFPSLSSLDLHQNHFGFDAGSILGSTFRGLPELKRVVVTNKLILPIQEMKTNAETFSELKILDTKHAGVGLGITLAFMTMGSTRLQSLTIHGGLSDAQAQVLASGLVHSCNVQHLDLRDNNLSSNGFHCILEVLHDKMNLKSLLLGGNNNFGAESARSLARILGNVSSLTTLDLSKNRIQAAEMETIAPTLPLTLVNLNLTSNEFRSNGCIALAHRLAKVPGLESLHIGGNKITPHGLDILGGNLVGAVDLNTVSVDCHNEQGYYIGQQGQQGNAVSPAISALCAFLVLLGPRIIHLCIPELPSSVKSAEEVAIIDVLHDCFTNLEDVQLQGFSSSGTKGKIALKRLLVRQVTLISVNSEIIDYSPEKETITRLMKVNKKLRTLPPVAPHPDPYTVSLPLPDDIMREIFWCLVGDDTLLSLPMVCTHWSWLLDDEEPLWRASCQARLPGLQELPLPAQSWKRLYQAIAAKQHILNGDAGGVVKA